MGQGVLFTYSPLDFGWSRRLASAGLIGLPVSAQRLMYSRRGSNRHGKTN